MKRRIPFSVRVGWTVASVVADFVTALFLVWLLGSLGVHWGYWHAWWVSFCGSTMVGGVLYPLASRLEYLGEGRGSDG